MENVTNNPQWATVIAQQILDIKAKQMAMRLEDINAHTTQEWQNLETRRESLEKWRNGFFLFHAEHGHVWSAA